MDIIRGRYRWQLFDSCVLSSFRQLKMRWLGAGIKRHQAQERESFVAYYPGHELDIVAAIINR